MRQTLILDAVVCQACDSHVMGLPGRECGPGLVEIPSLLHPVETTPPVGSVEKWTSLQKGGVGGARMHVHTHTHTHTHTQDTHGGKPGDAFTDTDPSL